MLRSSQGAWFTRKQIARLRAETVPSVFPPRSAPRRANALPHLPGFPTFCVNPSRPALYRAWFRGSRTVTPTAVTGWSPYQALDDAVLVSWGRDRVLRQPHAAVVVGKIGTVSRCPTLIVVDELR
jgi:hypothetical protein